MTRRPFPLLCLFVFALAPAGGALGPALPRPGAALEATLLAAGYLSLGAAAAHVREPGARSET